VKVEFHLPDAPDDVLVTAGWHDGEVEVASDDDARRARVEKAYRRTPVVVDDGAYRRMGTSGEVVIQPGTLEWFRAVTQTRAQSETGLSARSVPEVRGGYDPASNYRSFEAQMERLTR
jgi:hypothetical protein